MKKIIKFLSVLLVFTLTISMVTPATAAKKATKAYTSPVSKAGSNFYKDTVVKKGAVVFQNDFENANGNFLDGSNSYNYAVIKQSLDVAHSGKESVEAGSRKMGDAGIGLRISAANGLDIKTLVGCTVKFSAWVYFKDGQYSKAPSKVNFVIWNRLNKIGEDKDGKATYKQVLKKTVKKGNWTLIESKFTIVDATDNGMILIGTDNEKLSAAGYMTSYYMDDMKLEVVSVAK